MDSSGTLYRLIEEVNKRRVTDGFCGTMSAEDRKKAIAILLADPPKPMRNASINRFRSTVKRRLQEIFRKP